LEIQGNSEIEKIASYWNENIHDIEIVKHPIGSEGFFEDLAEYRYDKLDYLPRIVHFSQYSGKKVLEIGCGVGLDLLRFAKGGAIVTGIDLAETSIDLAKKNFRINNVEGELKVMNGEELDYPENSFDVVYAHGVIQYTTDSQKMIDEINRVLKPGGEAIMMVYNSFSWLNFLTKVFGVKIEHQDAPVIRKFTVKEFKNMLRKFKKVSVVPERFPVKTRLHRGIVAIFYNRLFVPVFNIIPRRVVRPLGWHLMAFVWK
jgi:ubiquinone/menaquinone biosynthesis C-methylase UbiE